MSSDIIKMNDRKLIATVDEVGNADCREDPNSVKVVAISRISVWQKLTSEDRLLIKVPMLNKFSHRAFVVEAIPKAGFHSMSMETASLSPDVRYGHQLMEEE